MHASTRVFATVELATMILSYTYPRAYIALSRINHLFSGLYHEHTPKKERLDCDDFISPFDELICLGVYRARPTLGTRLIFPCKRSLLIFLLGGHEGRMLVAEETAQRRTTGLLRCYDMTYPTKPRTVWDLVYKEVSSGPEPMLYSVGPISSYLVKMTNCPLCTKWGSFCSTPKLCTRRRRRSGIRPTICSSCDNRTCFRKPYNTLRGEPCYHIESEVRYEFVFSIPGFVIAYRRIN